MRPMFIPVEYSRLFRSGITKYDTRYTFNLYRGCSFDCKYCYTRNGNYRSLGLAPNSNVIKYPSNFDALLDRDMKKLFKSRQVAQCGIRLCKSWEAYIPQEKNYRLVRRLLERILSYKEENGIREIPFTIIASTRGILIERDIDLWNRLPHEIRFSFCTDDDDIRKKLEPGAPSVGKRLDMVEELVQAGLNVTCDIRPKINRVTDVPALEQAFRRRGVTNIDQGELLYYTTQHIQNWLS